MICRFYFDLADGHTAIQDEEGVEADNYDQALRQASAEIDAMHVRGEMAGIAPYWQLVIRDENGTILSSIPLS